MPPGQKYVESRVQLELRTTAGALNFTLSLGCKCEDDEETLRTAPDGKSLDGVELRL